MVEITKKIQISVCQLDNYGPWTVSPEPKPEAYLQMLQTRLFADLEDHFSEKGGLAFLTRFDNTLIVSNGASLEDHRKVQEKVREGYPVTLSFGLASAETPYEAQRLASQALQETGSSQSEDRREELNGEVLASPEEGLVQIAHIDINSVTDFTDVEPIYKTHQLIQNVYLSLVDNFSEMEALMFYTGGDNFMAPCNGLDREEIRDLLLEVEEETDIKLKAGVGQSPTAVDAAYLASEGLHEIRDGETENKVVFKEP